MTIRRMRIVCCITGTTQTGSVTLIAFPQQQWLCESTPMLRYTYSACLVTSGTCLHKDNEYVAILSLMTIRKKNQYAVPSISPT